MSLYNSLHPVAAVLQHTLIPTRYYHTERVTSLEAPYILISNHHAMLDPVAVAAPIKKYEISFLGKKEINRFAPVRWLVTKLHMIPVDRGHSDMEAMRACMKVLREGGVLGMFPEGTRRHEGEMEHIESGVSLIALRGRVPLVPVYIRGKFTLFHRVKVYFGEPIPFDDLLAEGINSVTAEKLNDRIRQTYRAMIAEVEGR